VDIFLCLTDGGRRLPKGSTVLLSSVTSLTMLGQAGYADRVVAEALRLLDGLGGDTAVVPSLLIMWGGG
jgi:hypothetical protein